MLGKHKSSILQPRLDCSPAPLSFAQESLWFIHQLEPNLTGYHLPAAWKLLGKLDVLALERSLSEVVERHEILRTSFPMSNGTLVQSIAPAELIRLRVEEVIEKGDVARHEEVQHRWKQELASIFDLERGPLLRVRLIRLEEHEHVLLLVMHHIVSDGWSVGI